MRVRRPSSATAAGVLCIIFGSIFTLCGVCGVVSLAVQGAAGGNPFGGGDPLAEQIQKELQRELDKLPGYNAITIGNAVVSLLHAVLILICGISILNLRSWARTLAVMLSIIGILILFGMAIYQTVVVIPTINNAFRVILPRMGPVPGQAIQMAQSMMTMFAIIMIVIYAAEVIYLGIIVILLSRSNVKLAFAQAAGTAPLDYDDRDDREREGGRHFDREQDYRRDRYEDEDRDDYRRPRTDPQPPDDDWRIRGDR